MNTHTPSAAAARPVNIHTLAPDVAKQWVERGEAVLVDVREPYERASAFIPGSHAAPLSSFNADSLRAAHPTARLIFQCKSGARSRDAARRFAQATDTHETWSLEGGIDAWRTAALPVQRKAGAPKLDIMRQVQLIAGGLVVLGTLLGYFLHPGFFILPAFVGSGLVFAGASGWCGMAKLLAVLPWNRVQPNATD